MSLLCIAYILLRVHATKENVSIYEEYNKEQIDLILEKNFVVSAKPILANTFEGKRRNKTCSQRNGGIRSNHNKNGIYL